MKKKLLSFIMIALLMVTQFPVYVYAAESQKTQELIEGKDIKVGNVTISKVNYEPHYQFYIEISVNGVSKKIIPDPQGLVLVSGSNLYYTLKLSNAVDAYGDDSSIDQIYKLNVKTLKTTKIALGGGYEILNLKSPYIYYGSIYEAAPNKNLGIFCKNLDTKKTVKLQYYLPSIITVGGKRICQSSHMGDFTNQKMYAYKFNGTGKTYIGSGIYSINIGNYLYYVQLKYTSYGNNYYRVVRTDLQGKNRKVLTKYILNGADNGDIDNSSLKFIKKTINK